MGLLQLIPTCICPLAYRVVESWISLVTVEVQEGRKLAECPTSGHCDTVVSKIHLTSTATQTMGNSAPLLDSA